MRGRTAERGGAISTAGRWIAHGIVAVGVVLGLAACVPPPADVILLVTTVADTVDVTPGDGVCADANGDCSLRAAVMEANADPDVTEIQLTGGATYPLTIAGPGEDGAATGDLDVTQPVYIRANAPGGTGPATIDAGGLDRIFEILGGPYHYFEGLVLTGGDPGLASGGAMAVHAGFVGIEDTRITGNVAGVDGGGIDVDGGSLWIEDSTLDANRAAGYGGAVHSSRFTLLYQTTVADNEAFNSQVASLGNGDFRLVASSFAGDAPAVGAVGSRVIFENSVLETTGSDCQIIVSVVESQGNNVVSDSSCGLSGPGDQVGDARLKPLADNGGPVPTLLPSFGSPALDAIAPGGTRCVAPVAPDARQQPRPVATNCDVGAVENQPGETTGIDCVEPPFIGIGAQLQFCDLEGEVLGAAELIDADLRGANLVDVDAGFSSFARATLVGADLSGANLEGNVFSDADLTSATLVGADLEGALFDETDAAGANLSGANLFAALVRDTDLTSADLRGTVFFGAIVERSDLTGANLLFADLTATLWIDTTCPDGTNSDDNGDTCEGHRIP